jgi:hypothetical protein
MQQHQSSNTGIEQPRIKPTESLGDHAAYAVADKDDRPLRDTFYNDTQIVRHLLQRIIAIRGAF